MKFIIILFAFCALMFAQSTQEKIKSSKNLLKSNETKSQQLNKKLDELAVDILKSESSLKQTGSEIKNLKEQISLLENDALNATAELERLKEQNRDLSKTQKDIEANIIKIIAEDLSFELFLADEDGRQNEDSIMVSQILSKLSGVLREDVKNLAKNYEDITNLIKAQSEKIAIIENNIKTYKRKQNELIALEAKQKKTIDNLKRDKEIYTQKLLNLQSEQDELRKTLERLAIIKKEEDDLLAAKKAEAQAKKKAEAQAKKKAQAEAQAKKNAGAQKNADKNQDELVAKNEILPPSTSNESKVKQFGSSYQASRVKKYTGAKTIAPLDGFSIKQKFGNYVDPIYNIKIFNESVTLQANAPDAKVRSVLSGKVVFAKQTPLLDCVVVIENSNGLHTIYAHLSQIAPTISVGSMVQKGAIIGRIKSDLVFEVMQKNYHIDPLELIALK